MAKKIKFPKFSKVKSFSLKTLKRLSKIITSNPVLISGLSLGPIVAISQSLKAGVSLSVAFAIIIIPVLVTFSLVRLRLSKSMRIILCCFLSCIFFIPAFWFAQTIFPEVNDKVGVFLPLMVVNPIISSRTVVAIKFKDTVQSLITGVKTTVCFAAVMCFVSLIREIIGKGTIWDKPISFITPNISFLLPFTGFIIVGFLAAGASALSSYMEKKNGKEAE